MDPWVARKLVYFPILALHGESLQRCLSELRAFNRLDADQMAHRQWQDVRRLLDYAYHYSPFYRNRCDSLGLPPDSVRAPADFARLPLLTKRDIQQHPLELFSREHLRVSHRHTSGSTGTPLQFIKDRRSLAYMDAAMHDCYGWHDLQIGDRQARIWGVPFGVRGRLLTAAKDLLLNRRRLLSFDIDEEPCRSFYHQLSRFRPSYLYGLPNAIADFARRLRHCDLDPAALCLKAVITTGETLFASHRAFLAEHFGCPIVNEYGCTESGIIAFECRAGRMHQINHNLYIEIVDPASGQPVPPGQIGELVLTELHSRAMPLLRYRLGDLASVRAEWCPCGLGSPLLGEIAGRVSELIRLPGGKKVAAAILDYSMPAAVRRFRCVQQAIDRLQIFIEPESALQAQELDVMTRKIRSYVGQDVTIDIAVVGRLPREKSGKLCCFISELDTEN